MGSMMKNETDMLTLQVRGDGPLGGITLPQTVKVMLKDMLIIRMLCCRQRMESLMWEVLLESVFYRL